MDVRAPKAGIAAFLLLLLTGCGKFFPNASTLTAITVSPQTATIHPATTEQFTARGVFSDGSSADITNQVSWKASDTGIVTSLTAAGLATAGNTGTAIISATENGVTGVAGLTVAP